MASPQTENGYTKIANEMLDALGRIRIPGEARQVLDVIIRKTYGFRKKKDRIALSQFNLATGLKQAHVCRALRKLGDMNMIIIEGAPTGNSYSINKDYDTWKGSAQVPALGYPKTMKLPVPILAIEGVPILGHTKERYTKENNKRKHKHMLPRKKPKKLEGEISTAMYNDVYRVLEAFEPVNQHWQTLSLNTKQYDASMRMIRIHGIEKVLEVVTLLPEANTQKFFPRIYTPVQLEEKWEMLHDAYTRGRSNIKKLL